MPLPRPLDTTPEAARRHTGAALTSLTGERLTCRVLTQLPHGYAFLYGCADLTAAAARRSEQRQVAPREPPVRLSTPQLGLEPG